MSTLRSRDEHFWQLADGSCNGPLAEHELRELEVYLQQPEQRQLYLNHCRLHCELALAIRGQQVIDGLTAPPVGAATQAPHSAGLSVISRTLPVRGHVSRRFDFRGPPMRLAAASLLVAGLFWTFWAYLIHVGQDDLFKRTNEGEGISAATLLVAEDCKWSSSERAAAPGESLSASRSLQIESGVMEIAFGDGTRVVVEGPADFAIHSSSQGFLRRGRLLATVPHEAIGFTVETPTIRVVDLGTEFGVGVNTAGQSDVEVITGKVDVRYESSTKPGESQKGVRMTAGTARRFSSRAGGDGVANTSIAPWVDKTAIGKNLAGVRKKLPTETKYAAAVLADRPLGYWRFSDDGKGIAADASGNGLIGEYHGFVSTTNPGISASTNDRSIRFLGTTIPGWIEINNVELPPSFAIELWARSSTPEWNSSCWLLSSDVAAANGALIHPERESRVLSLLVLDDQGTYYSAVEFAPKNISDRFHHYVFAFDAELNQAWMYFDGRVVNERTSVLPQNRRRQSAKLAMEVGRQRGRPERSGEGWIDELAIYPHILAADAVHRHYTAADMSATGASSKDQRAGNQASSPNP
jgi:hypothetical protein